MIDLSFNHLIGPVPSQWENLTSLSVLHLQGNEELCGGMPESLPSQPGLVQEELSRPCPDYITESILLSNFKNEVGDPSESLVLWRAGAPPCLHPFESWPGITCEDGRVVAVDLTDFQLSGTLPDTLAQLSMLKDLRLGGNRFTGSLPLSWAELFRLENLNVSFNALEGPLPPEWSVLVSLIALDLSGNNFEGSLPPEWSRMVQLQSLNVSENVNLCGGLPKELSENVVVISVNSTFLDACSSSGDPSWAIPFISVLISVFVMVTLFIWISCFCCCCYQRKKQRGKLLEMMSNNLSKNREAQSKEMQGGNVDTPTENGRSASEVTSQSAMSGLSPQQRYPMNYEVPYGPRAVHPYYPIPGNRSVRSSVSYEQVSRKASSSRSPTPASRRSKSQIPAPVSDQTGTQRRSTGFGSMQSVMGTTSHESYDKKTPRTPPAASLPRSQSALEMCRTLMEQPATPTECQPTVQRPRSSNQGRITPSGDPRRRASKIPRGPTPSATSSVKNGSSPHRSVTDRSVHSERRGPLSSASPSSSYQVHFVPAETEEQHNSPPERFAPSTVVNNQRPPDDRWHYPSAIPTASNRSTPSPTAEMFRWLESAYHSGTFDLDDVPRELLSKAAQQRQTGNIPAPSVSPQRYPALNTASATPQGMQTSTKELLMWLESRIEEARESELNRVRVRSLQARDAWGQTDSNGLPLFNYKTCSTVEDDSD